MAASIEAAILEISQGRAYHLSYATDYKIRVVLYERGTVNGREATLQRSFYKIYFCRSFVIDKE